MMVYRGDHAATAWWCFQFIAEDIVRIVFDEADLLAPSPWAILVIRSPVVDRRVLKKLLDETFDFFQVLLIARRVTLLIEFDERGGVQ